MVDEDLTAHDLALRPHSWRHYEPEEFVVAAKNSGKVEARQEFRAVEAGRFAPFVEAGHKFFRALDPDERDAWASRNPDMMEWIGAWGFLMNLNTFEEWSGIEQELM